MSARRVVAVVGATATGKTALGGALAARVGGEVVCADARQVFRELEIGTGKPTPAERAARPHHLFDAWPLGAPVSAGAYARRAAETCERLFARGVTPVLVGGSGLYLEALRHGLHALPPPDPAVRARLAAELQATGAPAMHARLAAADPAGAARLAPADRQRVLRALEVLESSGRPLSAWWAEPRRPALAADWRVVELVVPPRALAPRIEARTRAMFAGGLVEETRALIGRGQEEALRALRAIGYDEALELLAGRLDRAAAEARTSLRTRQLAKRQRTWFGRRAGGTRLPSGPWDLDRLLAAAEAWAKG